MPCNQGACALCVYKNKSLVSKEERSLKESHAGRIARSKVFINKRSFFFFFFILFRETDVHQRAQEADNSQERFICAETEIIDVWNCRLGRHEYSLLSREREVRCLRITHLSRMIGPRIMGFR